MDEDCVFDEDLLKRYFEEGYREGVKAGRERGFEEGFVLGAEEGDRCGAELGRMAGLLCGHLPTSSEGLLRKMRRTLQEIAVFPLDNAEDGVEGPSKEQRLLRIRGAYREISTSIASLPKEPSTAQKAKFDF